MLPIFYLCCDFVPVTISVETFVRGGDIFQISGFKMPACKLKGGNNLVYIIHTDYRTAKFKLLYLFFIKTFTCFLIVFTWISCTGTLSIAQCVHWNLSYILGLHFGHHQDCVQGSEWLLTCTTLCPLLMCWLSLHMVIIFVDLSLLTPSPCPWDSAGLQHCPISLFLACVTCPKGIDSNVNLFYKLQLTQ